MSAVASIVLLAVAVVATVPSTSRAATSSIYKCVADGTTRYQDVACDAAHENSPHAGAPPRTRSRIVPDAPGAERSLAVGPESADELPLQQRGELVPGMTDTIVLNRAGWGRPRGIVRTLTPEGYRERWTYPARADGSVRVLLFLNGRLSAIEDDAPPAIAAAIPDSAAEAAVPARTFESSADAEGLGAGSVVRGAAASASAGPLPTEPQVTRRPAGQAGGVAALPRGPDAAREPAGTAASADASSSGGRSWISPMDARPPGAGAARIE